MEDRVPRFVDGSRAGWLTSPQIAEDRATARRDGLRSVHGARVFGSVGLSVDSGFSGLLGCTTGRVGSSGSTGLKCSVGYPLPLQIGFSLSRFH
jgi:hypothetical protein